MATHSYSTHLDATEEIRTSHGSNHDALHIEQGSRSESLVLAHYLPAATRVRFLRELSEAASDLARDIDLRDLEAAS